MEEVKQEEANSCSTKEVTIAASSSSVSDSSCDTSLPKLATVQGCSLISKRTTGPTRRSKKGGWTELEDNMLTNAVKLYGGKNWKKIATRLKNRTDVQCLHRWQKVLNPELVKGPWTKEEDDLIIELVEKNGSKKWSVIAQSLPGRIGKQCRERWHNHLNPAIKKDAWTNEEEVTLIRAHQIYGNKWAEIARFLPGRADNSIKNHWNCSVKKKLDTYSASGFAGDLPGVKALDLSNHETKLDFVKVDVASQSPGTVVSYDKKMDLCGGAPTCLVGSALGNSNDGDKDLQLQPLQATNSRASLQQVNYPTKQVQCDGRCATASGPVSEKHEDDTNNGSKPDDLKLSIFCLSTPIPSSDNVSSTPSSSIRLLDLNSGSGRKNYITPSETEPCVTAKRLPESPKRPKHCSPSPNSSGGMDLRPNLDSNSPFSSSLACEFGNYSVQVGRQSKVHGASKCSDGTHFGRLCYEPPQLMNSDIFFEKGRLSSISPVCSTPPSRVRTISVDCSSPESVLRSAAKSFKNTPSIIRKRGREICGWAPYASDSDGVCTPEVRPQRSNDMKGFMESSPHAHSGQEDLDSRGLLNVQWLSLSSSNSLKRETAAAVKSVRLEYAFDLECDDSRAKYGTSVAASDASDASCDANTGLMPRPQLELNIS
ncbi:SANT/Myb domain [Macleaya cordata]|uniref:SANT/Myb domain n=1 Tax=Macleaya cordata TaxID=56857 RepID=A0A200QUJ6_MACCD|nr:SANT/Myb domain [Macleaya cordata]